MSVIVNTIDALRERPKLLRGIFLFILGAILVYDFIAVRHGEHFVGDRIRMFWAAFAFVGAVGMTKFMKWLGATVLMKPYDFYDRFTSGEEE